MKKIIVVFVLFFGINNLFAQAKSQLNFGLIGVSYEIPLATDVSIAPFAGINPNFNWLSAGVKANYYFDTLLELPSEWDVYAGVNTGYAFAIKNNSDVNCFDIGLHVGGRWFWCDRWGVFLELGSGIVGATSGLGITMKM